MAQYAIITDLDRCCGCLSCSVACKVINNVQIGSYWSKVLRVGPNPKFEGAQYPDTELYFLPVSCQHCQNPACVEVCPTGASVKTEDGTVQISSEKCIGCGLCLEACPYGVRYVDAETNVAQKCNMCADLVADGGLPQCVTQCCGMARWFGDLDEDLSTFRGARGETIASFLEPFEPEQVHTLPDTGNGPSYRYILRNMQWRTAETTVPVLECTSAPAEWTAI